MKTNDPQNLKLVAEKLSADELAKWLDGYLRNWLTNDPPFRAPTDQAEPGSFLGEMLDSLAPNSWDSLTHVAFANAAFYLFQQWSWTEHPFPLQYWEDTYIEDVLYLLEKYPTSSPELAATRLWKSLTEDPLDEDKYAKTLLAFDGQLQRHPRPEEYKTIIPVLEARLLSEKSVVAAFDCILRIDRSYAITRLLSVYDNFKKRGVLTDYLLFDVARRFHDEWDLLICLIIGKLGDYEEEVVAKLNEEREFLTKFKAERKQKEAVCR